MIEVSQTTLFMLYLCMTLGPILGLWLYHHYSRRNQKIDLAEQKLYACEYCQFCYLDRQAARITRCPQCQSYNKSSE